MAGILIIGALINGAAILAGGGVGLVLKGRLSDKFSKSIMRVLGLCICIIGIQGGLGGDVLLMVISLALGALVGELINIDGALNRFGLFVQSKLKKNDENSTFAQGFVTATLLFCVGAMAVVGSIDSGLRGDQSIIISKSIIDAVAAMTLASTFGVGVLFSAFTVFAYQGTIEIFAGQLQNVFTDGLITQISAVGGVMILGLGFNMVADTKIKVANLLPGIIFAAGYYYFFMGRL